MKIKQFSLKQLYLEVFFICQKRCIYTYIISWLSVELSKQFLSILHNRTPVGKAVVTILQRYQILVVCVCVCVRSLRPSGAAKCLCCQLVFVLTSFDRPPPFPLPLPLSTSPHLLPNNMGYTMVLCGKGKVRCITCFRHLL